jgi:hypothetical protein
MPFILFGAAAVLFVLLLTGTVAGPWFVIGIPVIVVGAIALMLRSAHEETGGGATRSPEPTGVPRSSASSTGAPGATANERVGQA